MTWRIRRQGMLFVSHSRNKQMILRAKDSTQQMQTLSECIEHAKGEGFIENFNIVKKGLCGEDGTECFTPGEVSIRNFYRFEGYSDPGDNAILFLIETDNHRKGIVVDAYDAYADAAISKFIKGIGEIRKVVPSASSGN